MRGAMVARWIPDPKVACSIHVAFKSLFAIFVLFFRDLESYTTSQCHIVCSCGKNFIEMLLFVIFYPVYVIMTPSILCPK